MKKALIFVSGVIILDSYWVGVLAGSKGFFFMLLVAYLLFAFVDLPIYSLIVRRLKKRKSNYTNRHGKRDN